MASQVGLDATRFNERHADVEGLDLAPQVFLVEDDQLCVVRPDAARHFAALYDDIAQAARDCPVEVIKFEPQTDGK